MRRSSRLTKAASNKEKNRMSKLIAARAERLKMRTHDDDDEWEEEEDEEMPGQEEGEELFGEDDEEYTGSSASDEDEDFPPISKQLQKSASSNTTTRKKIDVDVFSDSSEEDEELAYLKSIGPSKHDKVKELISRQKIKSKEPISILKKASKYSPKISTKSTELPKKVSSKASKTQLKKEISTHIRPGSKKAGSKLTGILKTTTEASGVISSTVDHFFDEILEWDLYSSLKKEFQKESDGSGSIGEEDEEIIKVPSQFRSYDHYFSVWKPLALQEVRAQALNGIMTDRPVAVHIKAKAPAGSFLAGTCKIRLDHKQRLSSHQKDHLNSLFSNDLVLLTPTRDYFDRLTLGDSNKSLKKHTKNNHDKKQQSNKRSEIEDSENSPEALMPPKSVLGIVNSQKSTREGLLIRVLSASWRTIDQEEDLYLFKVSNLITSVREFRALCDCKDYNLMPLLLSGHHKQGSMQLDTLGIEYVRWLQRTFNESQLEAITAAATSHGFTLIKGPPGTGKTTTLKGLLNSLHLREYSCYYNAVLDVARRPDHETEKAWAAIGNEKPHILVTAPSNAAVDNIVGKVMEEGFCDGEGRRYFPQIVRVGRGLSANVRSVGLEEMVDQICSQPLEVLEARILQLRGELSIVEVDSVKLRNELRRIVAWIDSLPLQPPAPPPPPAREEDSQEQPPPPPDSPPLSPPTLPLSTVQNPATPVLSNALRPVCELPASPSPPCPSSPPGPASPMCIYTVIDDAHNSYYDSEEGEDTGSAPIYGTSTTSGESQNYNAAQAHKAFNALLDDGDSDVDEPLPSSAPHRSEEDEAPVGSFSSPPPPPTESPPPLPPSSPPPPPPLGSPPPISNDEESSLHSSPKIALSTRGDPTPEVHAHVQYQPQLVDYTAHEAYRFCAQRINCCLEKLSSLKLELQRFEFARRACNQTGSSNQATRQQLEVSFLDSAHIVFTTLSSAGLPALDASTRYDVLVVDEAAQAVELSTIIPMKFGSRQCVLVGDPQQLSATVFSRTSAQSLYERSLFERLESCGHPVHMLRTQYRSHPIISDFPRNYFYEGKLQDGDNVKTELYSRPYHKLAPAFKPLVFWNLLSSRESTSSRSVSRMNVGEAELSVNLYLTLRNSCPPDSIAGKVGMITPYSQQLDELKRHFKKALGDRYETEVEINTVDGFQGREKDIIILSTVRADPRSGVGFLNDIRRMNVSLTRAKFACYVIGSEATLRSSKPWSALLDHSYKTECIVHVENPTCNLLTLEPMVLPRRGPSPRDHKSDHSFNARGHPPQRGFQAPPHISINQDHSRPNIRAPSSSFPPHLQPSLKEGFPPSKGLVEQSFNHGGRGGRGTGRGGRGKGKGSGHQGRGEFNSTHYQENKKKGVPSRGDCHGACDSLLHPPPLPPPLLHTPEHSFGYGGQGGKASQGVRRRVCQNGNPRDPRVNRSSKPLKRTKINNEGVNKEDGEIDESDTEKEEGEIESSPSFP